MIFYIQTQVLEVLINELRGLLDGRTAVGVAGIEGIGLSTDGDLVLAAEVAIVETNGG